MTQTAKKSHAIWTQDGEHLIVTRFSHNAWHKNREGVRGGAGRSYPLQGRMEFAGGATVRRRADEAL
jgi:hypothetical protein